MKHFPNRKNTHKHKKGFLLLDAVIGLGLFATAALACGLAIQKAGDASALIENRSRITRLLACALEEALSKPVLQEEEYTIEIEEMNMTITTEFVMLPELENQDGQILQDMWEITVTGEWIEGTDKKEESASTWRYGRLYQP